MAFGVQIIVWLISLSVFNHLTVVQSPVSIDIIVEIFQLLVPAHAEFQSAGFIFTDIALGGRPSQHSGSKVIVNQNIGATVVEHFGRCRKVLPHPQIDTYIVFVGSLQLQSVHRQLLFAQTINESTQGFTKSIFTACFVTDPKIVSQTVIQPVRCRTPPGSTQLQHIKLGYILQESLVGYVPSGRHRRIETEFVAFQQYAGTVVIGHHVKHIAVIIIISCKSHYVLAIISAIHTERFFHLLTVNDRRGNLMFIECAVIVQFCLYAGTNELVGQFGR